MVGDINQLLFILWLLSGSRVLHVLAFSPPRNDATPQLPI